MTKQWIAKGRKTWGYTLLRKEEKNISQEHSDYYHCNKTSCFATNKTDLVLLHNRLGHLSVSKMECLYKGKHVDASFICDTCSLAKCHRLPFAFNENLSSDCFDILHLDLWSPYKLPASNRAKYFMAVVDDKSRATWTFLLHGKQQVWVNIHAFVSYVKTQFGRTPKVFRTDNYGEFVNTNCQRFFAEIGIVHQRTIVYTPQQNGVVERKHHHLL